MIVNGREIAESIYEEIGDKLSGKRVCFIVFKESPEMRRFVELKCKAAERLGIKADVVEKDISDTKQALEALAEIIEKHYDGVVIQLPLPEGIDTELLFDILPKEIDIDVLGEEAKYRFESGKSERVPPVAGAVREILERNKVALKDKSILLLGYGKLVGEPVGLLLYKQSLTYEIIDAETPQEIRDTLLKDADVIISGIGVPHFIKPEMIKKGAVIIDAGTSEPDDAKAMPGKQNVQLVGDADPACAEVASLFTPVPGGVGPLTIAVLFKNLLYN